VDRGKSFAERKVQLLVDSLWIAVCGLAMVWAFWSYEASISYALGAGLGLGYVTLLSRYVEAIGTGGPGESGCCTWLRCLVSPRGAKGGGGEGGGRATRPQGSL
jgi:hypothetical protein